MLLPSSSGVRIANLMADTGAAWASLIGTHNSGTYTNQYIVVDLKRFQVSSEGHLGGAMGGRQLIVVDRKRFQPSSVERDLWVAFGSSIVWSPHAC